MAFSVNEVVRVACLSRSWFVYAPGVYKTNQLLDWQATRTTSLTLKAMQESYLCSQCSNVSTKRDKFIPKGLALEASTAASIFF